MEEKIKRIISDYLIIDSSEISSDQTFANLGLDSLDMVEIFLKIEDEFDIEIGDDDADKIRTISSLVQYLENYE